MIQPAEVIGAAFDVMSGPWEWGRSDCLASACAGFRQLTGVDLFAEMRGTYSSRAGSARIIRQRGGLVPMCEARAREFGLRSGGEETGDIGIVAFPGMSWTVLALCVRPGLWVARTRTGAAVHRATMVRCWRA